MRIAAAPAATGRDKNPTNQDCEKKTLFHHTPLSMIRSVVSSPT
jgi:hypothetical protein